MNWELDWQLMCILNKDAYITSSLRKCLNFLGHCIILFFFISASFGAESSKATKANLLEYLSQEKTHLTIAINDIKQHAPPQNEESYRSRYEEDKDILTILKAKIESLQSFLDNETNEQSNLALRLKLLQQMPHTNTEVTIQERVAKVENLLNINKKTTELISDNLKLAREYQALIMADIASLDLWKANYDLLQMQSKIKSQKNNLKKELDSLYQSNIAHQEKKHGSAGLASHVTQEGALLINNQKIALIHHYINILNIQKSIINAEILILKFSDTKTLQYVLDTYRDAINQYTSIENTLKNMNDSLNKESKLLASPELRSSIRVLDKRLDTYLNSIKIQRNQFIKDYSKYQIQMKQMLSSRQTLAEYSFDSWPLIAEKLISIPGLFYDYIKVLSLKTFDSYTWLDLVPALLLWISLLFTAGLFFLLNRILKSLSNDKERSMLTGYLYDGVLTILQRNIPYLCGLALLGIVFFFTKISYTNYQLLINLIAVWFTFRVLILIARLALLESVTDASGRDVTLYYRIKWLLLFGGWATALMMFSHLLPMTLLIQDIFNRLFMLFILGISLVAWKSKEVIRYLLRPLIKSKKRYLKTALFLLVTLIPITLFTTALIGMLGYINLAWNMSRYQAYTLLVIVAYILLRGLLFDALELLSQWMITSLKNGWLWVEVFLKPIDKIMRIVLFLTTTVILFQLFGWHSDSLVMISISRLTQYSLINITGIHITVGSIVEFLIIVAVIVWLAKWTREFCYRWLFKNTRDVGIRNSLSTFSQYAIILIGCFIALRGLGLDLSGMSMILGGLAVGMGFGLRDFASNIVGGIVLLIERPVREGDLVTVGEHEGEVSHIGIRSMRVSSWDNTEILIPNAETFNKPFTNWTHQDGIVRTVVPIKVSRSDDPVMIQQLILDVLAIIPEIVSDPSPQVFLKKIDTGLFEFEVRYFINVHEHNRVEVRSKVLFAITAQFKAAGVKPPIEPFTVELNSGISEIHVKNSSS